MGIGILERRYICFFLGKRGKASEPHTGGETGRGQHATCTH